MALTDEEREGMLATLLVLGTKSPEYYEKCTDDQLEEEYDKMLQLAEGGKR